MPRRGENIRKRKDGRWEGRYISGKSTTGVSVYRSIYGKSYSEVKNKLVIAINATQLFDAIPDKKKTVDMIALDWLKEVHMHKKYSTYVKYNNIYTNHIKKHIGNKTIFQVSSEDCIQLLEYEYMKNNSEENHMSKSTFNSMRNVLFQILTYGKRDSLVHSLQNQLNLPNERVTHQCSIFSMEEQMKLQKFLTENMDYYTLGIYICLFTGLRLGEICALSTQNINLDQKVIYVKQTVQRIKSEAPDNKTELRITTPKTSSSMREIPLCDVLIKILKENMPDTKYLINGNSVMEPRTYQYKFKRILNLLSIENKNFHTLRHTFATNCIASGMDPKCLSELLGHADVKTTLNRYVHPSFETKRNQINVFASNFGQISGQI